MKKLFAGSAVKPKSEMQPVLTPPTVLEPKSEERRPVGRPRGKRTDPEYRQVGAWVKKKTYNNVTKALIDEDRREFSDLVQTLLEQWLASKQ